MAKWTFLTNHSQVLLCIARNRKTTAKEIAAAVGITERAVQRLIRDLEEAGYISRIRDGRQNAYEIHPERPMRHPAQNGHVIRELIDVLSPLTFAGAQQDTRVGLAPQRANGTSYKVPARE